MPATAKATSQGKYTAQTGAVMSDWKKEFDREERLQQQYEEWFRREMDKSKKASRDGDSAAARKHNDNAKRVHKMGSKSIDRMGKIVPVASSGCLMSLLLLPIHLLFRWISR